MKNSRLDLGFTLLEVMIAVLIMSLGVMGVAALLTTSLRTDRQTQRMRAAELLGLEKLEDLTAQAPNQTITDLNAATKEGQDPVSKLVYRWVFTQHTSNTKTDPSGLYRIDMTVGWGKCKSTTDPTQCKRWTTMSKFIKPKQ